MTATHYETALVSTKTRCESENKRNVSGIRNNKALTKSLWQEKSSILQIKI